MQRKGGRRERGRTGALTTPPCPPPPPLSKSILARFISNCSVVYVCVCERARARARVGACGGACGGAFVLECVWVCVRAHPNPLPFLSHRFQKQFVGKAGVPNG